MNKFLLFLILIPSTVCSASTNLTNNYITYTSGTNCGPSANSPCLSNSPLSVLNGNVGVGSTNPGQVLDVQGTTRSTYFVGNGSGITNLPAGSSHNPTASIGLSVVNGSATTFMTSDSAPPLSQSITPTWTGTHTFNGSPSIITSGNVGIGSTSPAYALSVKGCISTDTFICVNTFAGIQAAINKLQATGLGGTVHVVIGNYVNPSSITMTGAVPIRLEGEGYGTTFNPQSGIDTFVIGDGGNGQRGLIQMANFAIYGQTTAQGGSFNSGRGIVLININNSVFEDIFIGYTTGAVDVTTSSTTGVGTTTFDYSISNKFDNLVIGQNDNYGIQLYMPSNATNGFINDNDFVNVHLYNNAVEIILNSQLTGVPLDTNTFTGGYIEQSSSGSIYPATNNIITSINSTDTFFTAININNEGGSTSDGQISLDSNSAEFEFTGCVIGDVINSANTSPNAFGITNSTYPPNFFLGTVQRAISIGTTDQSNGLNVNSNASIGYQYGKTGAPSNGLSVLGNVGIGTFTAGDPLTVAGSILLGGNLAGGTTGNVGIGTFGCSASTCDSICNTTNSRRCLFGQSNATPFAIRACSVSLTGNCVCLPAT